MNPNTVCPHCKRPMPNDLPRLGGLYRDRILNLIASRDGVSSDEIADAISSTHPNGGPDNARVAIRVIINLMNKKLAPDWKIESTLGRGARYFLIRKSTWTEMWSKPFERPELL